MATCPALCSFSSAVSTGRTVSMMIDEKRDISVVICAYTEERWHDLVAAVESLQRQLVPPREIIVVIDYNARLFARTQEQIAGVVVTENTKTRGLSGARNQGIAIA